MRISHSKVELYSLCGMKYKFKYIDKLEPDKTFCALLFGISIDKALNYILTRTKRHHIVHIDTAKSIFLKYMARWTGDNELVYYKNEAPEDIEMYDPEQRELEVWEHLCGVGQEIISTYKEHVLPLFAEIISVQTKKIIPNADGDELVLITDFVAKLHDGRVVVFDNKTTSDVKKAYPKTAVAKSQQLAIYAEFENTNVAGYIALQKRLVNGKVLWKILIDEVPEDMSAKAFEKIDQSLRGIKAQEFEKNEKGCWSYGKLCDYWDLCKNNSDKGLVKSKR